MFKSLKLNNSYEMQIAPFLFQNVYMYYHHDYVYMVERFET